MDDREFLKYLAKNCREATSPVIVQVLACDKVGAVRKDFRLCAFVKSAKRQLGALDPVFLGQIAYVDQYVQAERKRVIFRYTLNADCVRWIGSFDRGDPMPGSEFILMPPSPARTLAGRKAYKAKKRKGVSKSISRPKIRRTPIGRSGSGYMQKIRGGGS